MASDPKSGSPRPFDVKTVEYLISLMAQHELSEISLGEGDQRIRLRKGGIAPAMAYMPAPAPMVAAPATPSATAPAVPAAPVKNYLEIKSPMVGTYYSKASPDKPDYVNVGSKVSANTVVCKLEAMKIFNDLTADVSGTIVEVCIKNSQPVDFGTVLFRVEPS